jgi:hypothetical protein
MQRPATVHGLIHFDPCIYRSIPVAIFSCTTEVHNLLLALRSKFTATKLFISFVVLWLNYSITFYFPFMA